MTETKFTPGPWEAGRADVASIVDGVDSKWIYAGGDYCAIASGRVTGSWETVMANAHLIAAAPELYHKLAAVRKWMDEDDLGPWEAVFCAEIDALLAKARGEA